MARPAFWAAVVIAIIQMPALLHAQGSVTLEVCNTGLVDIDVFVSPAGTPFDTHIRPTTCAVVAEGEGGVEPAYLGLAFTDARGKWGAARRLDEVPYMGHKPLPLVTRLAMKFQGESIPDAPLVLSAATRSESVRHGNANVSLPMQLYFQPRIPDCRTAATGGGMSSITGDIIEVATLCEDLVYTLTAEVYPDTGEINLGTVATIAGSMSQDGPVRITEKTDVNWAEVAARRKERDEPQPANLQDLLQTIKTSPRPSDAIPDYVAIRGTVASVEVRQLTRDDGTPISRADITFREAPIEMYNRRPLSGFIVCTEASEILQEVFGADFQTSMVGKPIEVRGGMYAGDFCQGLGGSIRVYLARQIRPVQSVQFAAGTRVWVPPPVVVKPPPPAPTIVEVAAEIASAVEQLAFQDVQQKKDQMRKNCVAQSEQYTKDHPGDFSKNQQQYYECKAAAERYPVVLKPPIVVPSDPAEFAKFQKAMQDERERETQERMATQQRFMEQAMEQAKPCAEQLLKRYPNTRLSDRDGYQQGVFDCAAALSKPSAAQARGRR